MTDTPLPRLTRATVRVDALLVVVACALALVAVAAAGSSTAYADFQLVNSATVSPGSLLTGTTDARSLSIERPVDGLPGARLVAEPGASGENPNVRIAVASPHLGSEGGSRQIWPADLADDGTQALLRVLSGTPGEGGIGASVVDPRAASTDIGLDPLSGWTWPLVLERIVGGRVGLRVPLRLTTDEDLPDLIVPEEVATPEPGSAPLLLAGLLVLLGARTRRRSRLRISVKRGKLDGHRGLSEGDLPNSVRADASSGSVTG